MPKVEGPPPLVTGISPIEGHPGTKLTIRGENLGVTASDLTHVFINQIDVGPTAQWFSSKKITAITPLGEGEMEVVVVTNSGKFGSATVSYRQTAKRNVGPQTSVSHWPEDERRHCPAIYEHGSEGSTGGSGGGGGGSGSATDTKSGAELDPSTGLPMSELTRISVSLSDSALRSIYPVTGSVQLTDKEFDPVMFLLKFYRSSTFNDLTVTFNNFRKSIRVEGLGEPVNVIRTNLLLIFRCLDGMDRMRSRMLDEKKSAGGNSYCPPLESSLSDCRNRGHSLFEGILKRRDRAESTRNAIAVMQRYQFLFNLPHAIRSNISKGDYNLVLNDYLRAKSLFANSDVEILRRVYADVENVIENFRHMLRNQLTAMPIECDEAKRKISYLNQLEVNYDPTWLCLLRFKEWLVDRLHLYQRLYRQAVGSEIPGPTVSTSASSQNNSATSDGNVLKPDENIGLELDEIMMVGDAPPMLCFVRSVCRLLINHVVQFWRLGSAYTSMTSSLGGDESAWRKSSPAVSANTSDTGLPMTPADKKMAWLNLNLELVHFLSNSLHEEVLESVGTGGASDAAATSWLPECIREFRNCLNTLPLFDLPVEICDVFSRLAHDLRRHAVRGIFRHAQIAIEALQLKETWDVDVNDTEGGTTRTPMAYEEIMLDALEQCQEHVSCRASVEKPLFDSAELQERFPDWCGDAMVAFISTLRRLADQIESTIPSWSLEEDADTTRSSWIGGDMSTVRQSTQSHIMSQARGLILVLNNAQWAGSRANLRLLTVYRNFKYASPEHLQTRLADAWNKGSQELGSRYVRLRTSWIITPIKSQMMEFVSTCSTNPCTHVTGAHSSIRSVIGNLAHIYSELVLLLGRDNLMRSRQAGPEKMREIGIVSILAQICVAVVERVRQSLGSIQFKSLPRPVQMQLLVDVRTFRAIVPKSLLLTETQRVLTQLVGGSTNSGELDSAKEILEPQEQRYLDRLVEKEQSRMRLLVEGFRTLETKRNVVLVRS
ncbi:Exocyst complex component 2 [Fasciola hepatica]|uniref:Exocyst complex component 2 n=1 Tax=Fasciola hepatica TaxID=6192 RepID=A0A4E0RRB3_FASHE|nr:Exocyst complex component 2 [Fasciola hepatica]